MEYLHFFPADMIVEPPARFNNPFYYRPHPLCVVAANEVRRSLLSYDKLWAEASKGKMFGVLVVRDSEGRMGYLAAFSGLLGGRNVQPGFVPAVFDFQNPKGYFKQEEAAISNLNKEIVNLGSRDDIAELFLSLEKAKGDMERELALMRDDNKRAKEARDKIRAEGGLSPLDEEALLNDSRFRKAELRRLTLHWREKIEHLEGACASIQSRISELKEERRARSAALQEWLFEQFVVLNARGRQRSLLDIFKDSRGSVPPAGAGECAAPKLLQYAYKNGLQPICMAEFWLGASPVGEVRREGCYYGSCKGKCEPILSFMLQGLEVEDNALSNKACEPNEPSILYEDDWLLVVDKPSGMLSVPGKVGGRSMQELLVCHFGREDMFVAHRLDMSTSGILVVAKGVDVLKAMQGLFAQRRVKKCYTALLSAVPSVPEGEITLPLMPDYVNRPLQMVDFERGKEAVTRYRVAQTMQYAGSLCALVYLWPLTGRTHQLRVHCAHIKGLNSPIVGDELYGSPDERLMLHASSIEFEHPITRDLISIKSAPSWNFIDNE